MSTPSERSTKASQLMLFLDKVETEIDEDAASTIAGSNIEHYNEDTLSIASNTTTTRNVFNDIKQKMIGLKVELNDKTKTMQLLELALKKAKERQELIISSNKKDLKKQLNRQKKEFQIVTNRHLLFVDRLLNDKQNLSKQCEDLTNEIKSLEQSCTDKINKLENGHRKLLKKSKHEWIASEQIKREQFIKNKTKQIKEMTIKGLEPEIERLMAQNKKDLQIKSEEYTTLLFEEKEKIYQIFEGKFENMSQKLNKDKFVEINVLKNKHLSDIEALNKLKDSQLNEQMLRLNTQWSEERQRNKALNESAMRKLISAHKNEIQKINELNSEFLENNRRKHEMETKKMSEKYKIDKSEWIGIQNKKYQKQFRQKESEMIDLLKAQQKDEIDLLIDKLTNEYSEKIQALQSKNDSLIDEYKTEICEEKNKCKQWIAQYKGVNAEIERIQSEHSKEIERIEMICDSKNEDIQQLKQELCATTNEIQIMSECKENEMKELNTEISDISEKMNSLELKYKTGNERLKEIECEHNSEVEEMKRRHIMEIESIETRVRQTLCKKHDLVQTLKEQIQTKNMQIHQIENLLQNQRSELFDDLN